MFDLKIAASVGAGGKNLPDNVKTIQNLLNSIPCALGGPVVRLAVDSWVGPKTIGAIHEFQSFHFDWADGRVDPKGSTITKGDDIFKNLIQGRSAFSHTHGFLSTTAMTIDPLTLPVHRLIILLLAFQECYPQPGIVSDQHTTFENGEKIRSGWRQLKRYIDEGGPNAIKWTENNMKYLKTPRKRPRDHNKNQLHWCSVFATWIYQQTILKLRPNRYAKPISKLIRWNYPGINLPNYKVYPIGKHSPAELRKIVRTGDICNINNGFSHHFIAIAPPTADGKLWGFNSNSTNSDSEINPKAWFTKSNLIKAQDLNRFPLQQVYSADGMLKFVK